MCDDRLIERVRQADRAALATWLELERPRLLGIVAREMSAALRKKLEPDDILQEVAVDAVRTVAEVDLDGKDPFGWICELIRRRVIDAHRRYFVTQKRSGNREVALDAQAPCRTRGGGLGDMIVASITSPSAAFSRNQQQQRLADAMAGLPEVKRKALQLRYVEGKSTAEVAAALGKSHGSTRVLLSRTIQQLRDLLASYQVSRRS